MAQQCQSCGCDLPPVRLDRCPRCHAPVSSDKKKVDIRATTFEPSADMIKALQSGKPVGADTAEPPASSSDLLKNCPSCGTRLPAIRLEECPRCHERLQKRERNKALLRSTDPEPYGAASGRTANREPDKPAEEQSAPVTYRETAMPPAISSAPIEETPPAPAAPVSKPAPAAASQPAPTASSQPAPTASSQPAPAVTSTAHDARRNEALPPTKLLRPLRRQPTAMLCVVDDDGKTGEWIRLRQASTIIGRNDADVQIPHDSGISERHLEISFRQDEGGFDCHVRDLDSTTGTFVRAENARLRRDEHIFVGGCVLQIVASDALTEKPTPTDQQHDVGSFELVELSGAKRRWQLNKSGDNWLGRAADCQVRLGENEYLEPRHARIWLDEEGQWNIEDRRTLNGVWVAIRRLRVENIAEFLIGEQRLVLKVVT